MQSQRLSRVLSLMTWRKPTIRAQRGVMEPLAVLTDQAWNVCHWALERRDGLIWSAAFIFSLVVFTG